MATHTIVLSSFAASCTFDAGAYGGTNQVTGTFNFKRAELNRPHDGKGEFTADLESDGAITMVGWDTTSASSVQDISGFGGGLTAAGFSVDFDAWRLSIDVDTVVYSTFSSQWKRSKFGTAQMTGSCTGVLQSGTNGPVPQS